MTPNRLWPKAVRPRGSAWNHNWPKLVSDGNMKLHLTRKAEACKTNVFMGLGCAVFWSLESSTWRHLPPDRFPIRLASVPPYKPKFVLRSSLRQPLRQDPLHTRSLYFVTYPRGMAEAVLDEIQELNLNVREQWESQGALTLEASDHAPRLHCAKMVLRAARPPWRLPPELLGNTCPTASDVYDAAMQVLTAAGTKQMALDELGGRINELLPGASKLWRSQKRTSGPTKKGLGLAALLEQDSRRQIVCHSCNRFNGEALVGNTIYCSIVPKSRDATTSPAPEPSLDTFVPFVEDCASELKNWLGSKAWRATCVRSGDHPFRSPHIERCTAVTLSRMCAAQDDGAALGPVSMTDFEKEVVVCILHDLVCIGSRDALALSGSSRFAKVAAKRWLLHVSAACVARVAGLYCKPILSGIILDPMCGVGSNLIAVALLGKFRSADFVGRDIDETSVLAAESNFAYLGLNASFEVGCSEELPFDDNSVAMIVCEPPWGLRHSKASDMWHRLQDWVFEWMRVLKTGSPAFIITICTKIMEYEVIPLVLQKFAGTVLERKWVYDNYGFEQCTCYMLRKGRGS